MKTLEQIDEEFKKLSEEKGKFQKAITDIDAELLRLQGEYRIVKAFIDENTPVKDDIVPEPMIAPVVEPVEETFKKSKKHKQGETLD